MQLSPIIHGEDLQLGGRGHVASPSLEAMHAGNSGAALTNYIARSLLEPVASDPDYTPDCEEPLDLPASGRRLTERVHGETNVLAVPFHRSRNGHGLVYRPARSALR